MESLLRDLVILVFNLFQVSGILVFLLLPAYLIGSIPFGLLLTKFFTKVDIRSIGSGNIGATNVLRTGNKKLALLTLILDGVKGAFAVLVLTPFIPPSGSTVSCTIGSACGVDLPYYESFYYQMPLILCLCAVIGHVYPVWLKFKGGKGVATTLGVLLAAVPWAGVAACVTWFVIAVIFKISSLSALTAMVVAPVVVFFVYGAMPAGICVLISALVFWKHRENIKRLIAGEEPKISFKKKTLK